MTLALPTKLIARPTRLIALALFAALMLAACGGSDGTSAEDQAFVDAMVTSFGNDGAVPDGVNVTCVAENFVSELGGADQIEADYGVTAVDAGTIGFDEVSLTEADARSVVDGMWSCDGFEDSLYAEIANSGLTDDQSKCLRDNLDATPLKTLMASSFMGDAGEELERSVENEFELNLFGAFETCNIG